MATSELENVIRLMQTFDRPWAICGGWALDLFLGQPTRPHDDVDVAVLRHDQLHLQKFLRRRGWTTAIAHDGQLSSWADGEFLELPLHSIWCKNPKYQPDFVEILLNEADETHFLFRRDISITRELAWAFLQTESGIPILAPDIVLLYKASAAEEEKNNFDFQISIPGLCPEQRQWLKLALQHLYPTHAWLAHL